MFDQYIVVSDSLHNTATDGQITGYAVDARIPYYRGLGLSMVEVDLVVDGAAIPRQQVTFTVHGNSYDSSDMAEVQDDRWGFTEPATLTVTDPGGLAPGKHEVTLNVLLRISYAGPAGSRTTGNKILTV